MKRIMVIAAFAAMACSTIAFADSPSDSYATHLLASLGLQKQHLRMSPRITDKSAQGADDIVSAQLMQIVVVLYHVNVVLRNVCADK
jgi:hypothetical protein